VQGAHEHAHAWQHAVERPLTWLVHEVLGVVVLNLPSMIVAPDSGTAEPMSPG
jgi:hypothetical protein